ncbi:MAG: 2-phospho-L-lactate guanylyltransferase [Acidimicrobiales bacterium]
MPGPTELAPAAGPDDAWATALLVPVKAFEQAKGRLAGVLGAEARVDLARRMAAVVLAAAGDLVVHVVCDDAAVAAWAEQAGATVLWCPGRGLDHAVADGVEALRRAGFERAVVAHADLPAARSFEALAGFEGVIIVPDRREDGTNVISIPTGAGFGFRYGPGSFVRHQAEAARLGLALRVVREHRLGFDVDTPADLDELLSGSVAGPWPPRVEPPPPAPAAR